MLQYVFKFELFFQVSKMLQNKNHLFLYVVGIVGLLLKNLKKKIANDQKLQN